MIDRYGDVGGNKIILMDNERGAHRAVADVLPEYKIKSCLFHYNKNVREHVTSAKKANASELMLNKDFKAWLSQIIGKLLLMNPVLIYLTYRYTLSVQFQGLCSCLQNCKRTYLIILSTTRQSSLRRTFARKCARLRTIWIINGASN